MATAMENALPVKLSYIGCWYKNDMYSHNCSGMVDSLRQCGMQVDVVTSNCRCFSSAQKFAISEDELVNTNCAAIAIPHAPRYPGKGQGTLKYLAVKWLRLDLSLATLRGFLYYRRARRANIIHFDQVLEAFGCIPFFIVVILANLFGRKVVVTVHEIDPFQREHKGLNRLYNKCAEVLVYSENMKRQIVSLGVNPEKIKIIRYGSVIPELKPVKRTKYIYFGGHNILRGKGYEEMLKALAILKAKGIEIPLTIYVGHGCNGMTDAHEAADRADVSDIIEWREFYSGDELAEVYQCSKACIIPFTSGSARHPVSCAMVNATPVIATRAVDIPEYLGELGVYVDGSGDSIAEAILRIEAGAVEVVSLGGQLRAKAIAELDCQKIAGELSGMYSQIGRREPCPQTKIAPPA
jgi:glycosyltransferase involved in cell wall biosynthesis